MTNTLTSFDDALKASFSDAKFELSNLTRGRWPFGTLLPQKK